MDTNREANLFVYNSKVGDYYMIGDEKIEVVKRTPKRIHFSNGNIVSIKTLSNGIDYLTSRTIKSHNKRYPIVNQIIRDIEGFLIYKLLTKNNERFYKIY